MADKPSQHFKGPLRDPLRKLPAKVAGKSSSSQENINGLARLKTAVEPPRLEIKPRRALNDVGNRQNVATNGLKKTTTAIQSKASQLVTKKTTASTVTTKVLAEKNPNVTVRCREQKVQKATVIVKPSLMLKPKTTSSTSSTTVTSSTISVTNVSSNVGLNRNVHRPPVRQQNTIDLFNEDKNAELEKEKEAQLPITALNIDTSDDPLMVSIYINDIFKNLRDLEVRRQNIVNADFLNNHRTKPRIRQVLIDWLVDVHLDFKLVLETLHLTVSLIDEYLEKHKEVGKETLQLVGISALFIATKYEDVFPPESSELVCMCDNTFSKKEIFKTEQSILKTINFNIIRTYSIQFLRRFNQICGATEAQHSMGKYLLEMALLSYETCYIRPSLVAAAACCISKGIEDGLKIAHEGWTPILAHFARYEYEEIKETMLKLADVLKNNMVSSQQAVKNKYASSKFNKVSVHPNMNPEFIRKMILGS